MLNILVFVDKIWSLSHITLYIFATLQKGKNYAQLMDYKRSDYGLDLQHRLWIFNAVIEGHNLMRKNKEQTATIMRNQNTGWKTTYVQHFDSTIRK